MESARKSVLGENGAKRHWYPWYLSPSGQRGSSRPSGHAVADQPISSSSFHLPENLRDSPKQPVSLRGCRGATALSKELLQLTVDDTEPRGGRGSSIARLPPVIGRNVSGMPEAHQRSGTFFTPDTALGPVSSLAVQPAGDDALLPVVDSPTVLSSPSLCNVYRAKCRELGLKKPNKCVLSQLPDGFACGDDVAAMVDSLDFSTTYLGAKGCLAVASVFPYCTNLRSVSFASCGLAGAKGTRVSADAECSKKVFRSLQFCHTLSCLDVSNNAIDDTSGRALLWLLQSCPSITELNIMGTGMSSPLVAKMVAHMKSVNGSCYSDNAAASRGTVADHGRCPSVSPSLASVRDPATPSHQGKREGESDEESLSDEEPELRMSPSTLAARRRQRAYRRVPPFVAAALVELRQRLLRNRHCMQRVYDCFVLPDSVERRVSMGAAALPSHRPPDRDCLGHAKAPSLVHLEVLGASLDEATLLSVQQGTCSWKAFFRGLRVLGINSASRDLARAIAFASACGVLCAETVQFGKLINMLRPHAVLAIPVLTVSPPKRLPQGRNPPLRLETGAHVLAAYKHAQHTAAVYDRSAFYANLRNGTSHRAEDSDCVRLSPPPFAAERLANSIDNNGTVGHRKSTFSVLAFSSPSFLPHIRRRFSTYGDVNLCNSTASGQPPYEAAESVSRSVIPSMLVSVADVEDLDGRASALSGAAAQQTSVSAESCRDQHDVSRLPATVTVTQGGMPLNSAFLERVEEAGTVPSPSRNTKLGYYTSLRSHSQPTFSFLEKQCNSSARVPQHSRSVTWRDKERLDVLESNGLSAPISDGEVQFALDRLYDARHALRRCLQAVADGGPSASGGTLADVLQGRSESPTKRVTMSTRHSVTPPPPLNKSWQDAVSSLGNGSSRSGSPRRNRMRVSVASPAQETTEPPTTAAMQINSGFSPKNAHRSRASVVTYTMESQEPVTSRKATVCQWPVVEIQCLEDGDEDEESHGPEEPFPSPPLFNVFTKEAPPSTTASRNALEAPTDEKICWAGDSADAVEREGEQTSQHVPSKPRTLVPVEAIYHHCAVIVGAERQGVLQCVLGRCGIDRADGDSLVDFESGLLSKLKLRSGEGSASAMPPGVPISPFPPLAQQQSWRQRPSLVAETQQLGGRCPRPCSSDTIVRRREVLLAAAAARSLAPQEAVALWHCLSVKELQKLIAPF